MRYSRAFSATLIILTLLTWGFVPSLTLVQAADAPATGTAIANTTAAAVATPAAPAAVPAAWDNYSDTWVATDALGRALPTATEAGAPRTDKYVGLFYFLWHEDGLPGPFDNTKILAQDPAAVSKPDSPLWGPQYKFHHWSEPLFGYYTMTDEWVLRKHAQMLADAGVDVVIFDVTNQATYPLSYQTLGRVWSAVRAEGNRTPGIAFLCPFGDPGKVVRKLYDDMYSKGLYRDLWFQWKGKPLIMANPAQVDPALRDFFTFRAPEPAYFVKPDVPDHWGWLDVFPQHLYKNSQGQAEQMTVGVSQNSQEAKRCCAFSEKNTTGRSWHDGKKDERPDAVLWGLNFAEQWKRALEVSPEFLFVTGWNEWIALRLPEFAGVREPVMFVDQYTEEYSRDIEPMARLTGGGAEGHGDNYYYQMIDGIRRYKGTRPVPVAGGPQTIKIDGLFGDWAGVTPEYRDTIGDTAHRNHPGWNKCGPYVNNTGRNDFVVARVAYDTENISFYIRTKEPISPAGEPGWMTLFIDADQNHATGWQGYDFAINRQTKSDGVTTVMASKTGWDWREVAEVVYNVRGNEMEIMVPRAVLGLKDPAKPLTFDFKWADNTALTGNVMEFTTNGDTAPDDRYNYRFVGNKIGMRIN